jgi:anti-sigma B factor antagonist
MTVALSHEDKTTLRVGEIQELGAANAHRIHAAIRSALGTCKSLEIDLAETAFLDSCGIGVLIGLLKTTEARGGTFRVLNPKPAVLQILELTRMDRLFSINPKQTVVTETSPHTLAA